MWKKDLHDSYCFSVLAVFDVESSDPGVRDEGAVDHFPLLDCRQPLLQPRMPVYRAGWRLLHKTHKSTQTCKTNFAACWSDLAVPRGPAFPSLAQNLTISHAQVLSVPSPSSPPHPCTSFPLPSGADSGSPIHLRFRLARVTARIAYRRRGSPT